MGKRLLALLMVMACLTPSVALAAVTVDASFTIIQNGKSGVHYSFQVPGEEFVLLEYTGPKESGKMVIHAEQDNRFVGDIPFYYSNSLTCLVSSYSLSIDHYYDIRLSLSLSYLRLFGFYYCGFQLLQIFISSTK